MTSPGPEFLDPKVDLAFKALFGREKSRKLLASLLTGILAPEEPIVGIEVLSPFSEVEARDEKVSILDVRVRDAAGRLYAIEMQCRKHQAFAERILYYGARLVGRQLDRGRPYTDLAPVILIVFTDHVLFARTKGYHNTFHLWDPAERLCFTRHLRVDIIQLPRFDKPLEDVRTLEEQWMAFLKEGHGMRTELLAAWAPEVLEAREELERLSADPVLREQYEDRILALCDYITGMEGSFQQGEEQGIERGREQGRDEGKREALEDVARRLLSRGSSVEETAQLTRLTILEVQRLASE